MAEKIEINAAVVEKVLAAMELTAAELDSLYTSETEEECALYVAITSLRNELSARVASSQLSAATRRLLHGLVANNDDHLTACERTMGATHPCTCGADRVRELLRRGTEELNISELVSASDEALSTLCRIAVLVPRDDAQVGRAITALRKALRR